MSKTVILKYPYFLGLLCLVGGIIILIIFFVMKDTPEFSDEMFWIFSGAELAILSLASIGCVGGFIQVPTYLLMYFVLINRYHYLIYWRTFGKKHRQIDFLIIFFSGSKAIT